VDDKSTAILMAKFYENWKSGITKAEALRNAQEYVKSLEGYSHPFYWAAFELIGDGK
jgi:CHAT domain-containing protein